MNPYLIKLKKAYDGLKNGMKIPKWIVEGDSCISIPPLTKAIASEDYSLTLKANSTMLFLKWFGRDDIVLQRKFILECFEKLLKDSLDMERFGYEQIGFVQFRRKNIKVERVWDGIKIGKDEDGFFPFVMSKKRMKNAVLEYEKKNLNSSEFEDLSEELRDELVKYE